MSIERTVFTPLSFFNSSANLVKALDEDLFEEGKKYVILCDSNTLQKCIPLIGEAEVVKNAEIIEIEPTEESKSIEIAAHIWQTLLDHKFQKTDVLISLGGGVVCDLGGFVAATFKRGMRFRHIPTSYLAMVDASVGGKQGLNFGGAKNQIGIIQPQEKTYICPSFLDSLSKKELFSGFAETLKHGLVSNPKIWFKAVDDFLSLKSLEVIKQSVEVKQSIVNEDPYEKGDRKKLNFGHTIGHAIEALNNYELLHGEAVAWGMLIETYISKELLGFPHQDFEMVLELIKSNYPNPKLEVSTILELCNHDKKNDQEGLINFTLLEKVGQAKIDQRLTIMDLKIYLESFIEKYG